MTTLEGIRAMLDASGLTTYRVSVSIGRASSYVAGMLGRKSCPSADLLAKIADACGYDLCLIPRGGGDSLTLDGGGGSDG